MWTVHVLTTLALSTALNVDSEGNPELQMARTHSETVSGLHLSRAMFLSKDFGTGKFTVSNPEQCAGPTDELGALQCHIHLGETTKMEVGYRRNAINEGSTIEFDLGVDTSGNAGLASMVKVDPVHIKCPICGGTCEFNIPTGDGTQLVPTKEDLKKMPMVGLMALQMLQAQGVSVPQNRSELSAKVNSMMRDVAVAAPELFEEGAFIADDKQFVWGAKTVKFPLPNCPLHQLNIPLMQTPEMAGNSFSIDSETVGLSFSIPNMDLLDTVEGGIDLGVRIKERGTKLMSFTGSLGFNRLAKSATDLQQIESSAV